MEKVYVYAQSIMNGTVTLETSVAVFASCELAEETRAAILEENSRLCPAGLQVRYGDVMEIDVYASKDEIPFFMEKEHG